MFKKILLFGLLIITISVIVVSAYEDKFPRIGYTPPYMGGDSTYRQHFAQAVDTLHFTALIQNIPHFQSADFYSATLCSLNLVNTNATITFDASAGQYSMYQADRNNG